MEIKKFNSFNVDNDSTNDKSLIKKGFFSNIEKDTIKNTNYRKVLYTSENIQLVLMSLKPKEQIGMETHDNIDQFFRFEEGNGICIVNDTEYKVSDGDSVIVPSGSKHNIINTSDKDYLKLYTIYTPPHHKDGIVFKTKKDADKTDEHFDGEITES